MKAVIQRVKNAQCQVDGQVVDAIHQGLLVYVGFAPTDTVKDVEWMIDRVRKMRIFCDDNDKMNLSVAQVGGEVLWVPNFTLYCDASQRRPSFCTAMTPQEAKSLFLYLVQTDSRVQGHAVPKGIFGADMQIASVADGPINVVVESKG